MEGGTELSRLDKVKRYLRFSSGEEDHEGQPAGEDEGRRRRRRDEDKHQRNGESWFPLWTSDNGTTQVDEAEEEVEEEEEEVGSGMLGRHCDTILLVLLFAFSVVIAKVYYYYSTEVHEAAHQGTVWATTLVTNASMPSSATARALAASTVDLAHSVGSAAGAAAAKVSSQASWFWLKAGWLLVPVLSGLALTAFSWLILYLDSAVPGQLPPSPFSPPRIRIGSGYTFHLNYVATAFNGIALCAVLLWGEYGAQ